MNTTYYVIFNFLSAEIINDYYCVLDVTKKPYEFLDILNSKVIIINTNLSIIPTISKELLLTSYLLYLWHMNKNIMTNCKKLFEDKKL